MTKIEGTAIVIGMSVWKNFIDYWLPEKEIYRTHKHVHLHRFLISILPRVLLNKSLKFYVWGYKSPNFIDAFAKFFRLPLVRVEDGFIRSVNLGAMKTPPISLCFDTSGIYFDASKPSDLEMKIQNYDFTNDQALVNRAKSGIQLLTAQRLSKYNMGMNVDIKQVYGNKDSKRILVIGQVDHDMSIIKGCNRKISSNDLVRLAKSENPDAQIIYKPHPEILHGTRENGSDPREVADIAQVLAEDISLSDAFETIDHVYTITSLAGFEALIRDIPVTCIGAPFYSGWGVTDDRQPVPRRTAKRTVTEIFAAAYILYPRYFDPEKRNEITFEEALQLLQKMREEAISTDKETYQETGIASPAVP